MKNVLQIAYFIAALGGGVSQAWAGTTVYVPLGETGEILVLDAADEGETHEMEGSEVRVRLPTEQHFEEVSGIVREPVDIREPALQPAGQEVHGKRKAVHFRTQCDEESAEGAE